MLYTDYSDHGNELTKKLLKTPLEKREEVKDAKKKLQEYQDFKQKHIFLGQRERTIKGGWKHGITGIENADSEHISVFYKEQRDGKSSKQAHADGINAVRYQSKLNIVRIHM